MAKIRFLLLVLVLSTLGASAQHLDPQPASVRTPLSEVDLLQLPTLDNKALTAAEMARRGPGIAPRFAETINVELGPEDRGHWETLPNGNLVWRLRISSPGAHSLNLGFSRFVMPEGGSMILYSPDGSKVMGPFTPADNDEHEELWTPILPGDELVVEVQLPAHQRQQLGLQLKSVNHDFLGFSLVMSGSCNLDVICGAADGWAIVDLYRDIIQSVAVIGLNGGTFCTGFLVNNARQDCKPFFMTANHCGINNGNAASLVVYWNYVNSFCRQPNTPSSGASGNGSLADFNSGSIFRAAYAASDMTLVELDDPVSQTADAFFAGWNTSSQMPADTVIGIHHPSTDEKRISFEFNGLYVGSWGSGSNPVPNGNHLIVADWDVGTTEGGSSGSPLFNARKQVIGQLHGGSAACGNNAYDSYGWFRTSWEGGGTPQSRLRDWLDPDQTGITELNGRAQQLCSFFVEANPATRSLCAPDTATYTLTVGETFTGPVSLSVQGLASGLNALFSSTSVTPGATVTLRIVNTNAVASGTYNFTVQATDGTNTANTPVSLLVFSGAPTAVAPSQPANTATDLGLSISLTWTPLSGVSTYDWQLSLNPDFTELVGQGSGLTATAAATPVLSITTTYYWRVRANNLCGTGAWSETFTFTTGELACINLAAIDTPVLISEGNPSTSTSQIVLNAPGVISSIRIIGMRVDHTYLGDISATLTSPSGTTIQLFDRPGRLDSGFGCSGANLDVNFDDNAPNTADDFENTCDGGDPSILGDFQPIDAFSAFFGELATGTWTLAVTDGANFDGGSIINWQLDFCATIPSAVSVSTVENARFCESEQVSYEVTVGTGFTNPVTLELLDAPAGASVSFVPNPVSPGQTATMTLSGFSAGNYNFTLTADDGTDLADTEFNLSVQSAPAAPALNAPLDGTMGLNTSVLFSWGFISGASGYRFILSTSADLSSPIYTSTFDLGITQTTYSQLSLGTQYYWAVVALNECGESGTPVIHDFTTAPDVNLSVFSGPGPVCGTDDAVYVLNLGGSFQNAISVSYTAQPSATFGQSLSYNPNNRRLSITLSQLFNNAAGNYQVTFVVADAAGHQNSITVPLTILSAPALPALLSPAQGSVLMNASVVLSWSSVANATSYRVEIATDVNFTNIIQTNVVSGSSLSFTAPAPDQYYWRVTAINNCGDAVSSPFGFVFQLVDTYELGEVQVRLAPNPTQGQLWLMLDGALDAPVQVDIFAANGQFVSKQWAPGTPGMHPISVENLPAGLYLLRLTSGQAVASQRIIKQ